MGEVFFYGDRSLMKINRKQRLLPYLLLFMTLLGSVHHQAQTFTGEGDWKSPERWDTGSVPGDNDLLTVTLVTLNPDAAEPTLSLLPSPDGWVLDYTGQLVSSTEVQGDYQPVPGASSPYLLTPGEPQHFYRAVR